MADTSLLKLEEDESIAAASRRLGMSRREFLQFCAAMSATLGLPQGAEAAMAGAVAAKKRPSVSGAPARMSARWQVFTATSMRSGVGCSTGL